MHLRTPILVTTALLVLAAVPAAAQGRGPGMTPGGLGGPDGPGGPPSILHMSKTLGLSDAQQNQIESIENSYRDGALGDSMDAMREARDTLGRTIHDEKATDAAITQAAGAVAALEAPLALARHRMVIEISAVLTPDQKAKLEELAELHRGRPGPPPRGR